MRSLATARLYLVAGERLAAGRLADLVPELAAAGVDLVQLRDKDREARGILTAGEPIAAACRAAGIPFIVNDRPDVALALDADGVHLGQDDLPVAVARRILGERLIGRSTHSPDQIDAETALGVPPSYIAVGPLYPIQGRHPTGGSADDDNVPVGLSDFYGRGHRYFFRVKSHGLAPDRRAG